MTNPNDIGYICELCSKQWGNWSPDSIRELATCTQCEPMAKRLAGLMAYSKETLAKQLLVAVMELERLRR